MTDSYEKIQHDFENSRGARCYPPGIIPPVNAFRENMIRDCAEIRKDYRVKDETTCKSIIEVDLEDKYDIMATIDVLKDALKDLE